ncbi:MAG: DUF1302 family protein, partial [Desulfohalobiaceae bacterium]
MRRNVIISACIICMLAIGPAMGQEPSLPQGLDGNATSSGSQGGPSLPSGLGGDEEQKDGNAPALPSGLGSETKEEDAQPEQEKGWFGRNGRLPFQLAGFWDTRAGSRLQDDPHQKQVSLAETRLQLEASKYWQGANFVLKSDFLADAAAEDHGLDLRRGEGPIDLRSAYVTLSPLPALDLKVGRQVLTWGTGDQLFINDMFPKDWESFFVGRDTEYLKAPSNAARASLFLDAFNLDLVYTPRFNPDRYIDGQRVSYYHPSDGISGRDNTLSADLPGDWITDDEIALRLYRNVSGMELAAYAYDGYWKSPAGFDQQEGEALFPELSVYGASARGSWGPGIGSLEVGYYDSKEDRDGDDPGIKNSQLRFLAGYELEPMKNTTVGGQYYLERMLDYEEYKDSLPPGSEKDDENRHVLTLRLTRLYWMQTLELSLFTFYSPSDQDAYLRPRAVYDVTDNWRVELGGNLFFGKEDHTFFGQFQDNTNA